MADGAKRVVVLAAILLASAEVAHAQAAIAGVVRDATGAVLPGVTVEASSPALIEKIRTAVTDAQGQYKVLDLRPGTYTATFTLPGFSTVKREGIELSAGFTAPINVEMRIGALEETVTVSGTSPLVDVQSTARQQIVGRREIETLPTGKNWLGLAAILPGVVRSGTADVGGMADNRGGNITAHDSGAAVVQIAGINNYNTVGNTALAINDGAVQEIAYTTSTISVEMPSGGVVANVIPREGGNQFSGTAFFSWAGHQVAGNNLSEDLKARGVPAPDRIYKFIDENLALGGPIMRDRIWFFAAQRAWYAARTLGNTFYSIDPLAWTYNPDFSRPAIQDPYQGDQQLRITWQVTPRNKLTLFHTNQQKWVHFAYPNDVLSGEANQQQKTPHLFNSQAMWTSPIANRLLFEAGASLYSSEWQNIPHDDADPTLYPVIETSTGRGLVAMTAAVGGAGAHSRNPHYISQTKGSLTYVTGSHALKGGFTLLTGRHRQISSANHDTYLRVLNGQPQAVTVLTTPYTEDTSLKAGLGLYAQDGWTVRRLTVNVGARFDYLNWQVNAQSAPGGRWIGPRSFDLVPDVPNWKELSPRVGVAYDLFGTGRTALKGSVSRYVALEQTVGIKNDLNPFRATVNSATRPWQDLNNDRVPQENELGPLSNPNFGRTVVTTQYDDDVRRGWFKRPYNWEYAATLQHEIRGNVSAEVGYFRRAAGNFTVTDNRSLSASDYEQFCVIAPIDARLPGGGGNQICGLYDRTRAAFSRPPDNVVTFVDRFGKQTRIYNGIDVTVSARFAPLTFVRGGVSTGSISTSNCAVVDSPETRFCDVTPPWVSSVNIGGSYQLPWWGLSTSAVFQSYPGPQITATWNVPNSLVAPSLGRNLAACGAATTCNQTVPVALIEPGRLYGDRRNQVDWRVSKAFGLARGRSLEVMADVYNALNANPVITQNNTYGPEWQRPTSVLLARYLKLGAQFKF